MASKVSVKSTTEKAKPRKQVRQVTILPEVATDVVATAELPTTVTEVTESERLSTTVKDGLEALLKHKLEQTLALKQEVLDLKALIKAYDTEVKETNKKKKVKRPVNVNRVPSGIAKPTLVSNEMYTFLSPYGVKKNELVPKTTAFKYITTYIKEKNLQNPLCKTEFIPDKTLDKLFTTKSIVLKTESDPKSLVYTYTKIMLYIKKHFEQDSKSITV
jgi:chromatin remodeling complex protein RSC6